MAGWTKGSPPENETVSMPTSRASDRARLHTSLSMKSVSEGRRHIWQVRLQYSLSAISIRTYEVKSTSCPQAGQLSRSRASRPLITWDTETPQAQRRVRGARGWTKRRRRRRGFGGLPPM